MTAERRIALLEWRVRGLCLLLATSRRQSRIYATAFVGAVLILSTLVATA